MSLTPATLDAISIGQFETALRLFQEMHRAQGDCDLCSLSSHQHADIACACRLEGQLITMALSLRDDRFIRLQRRFKDWRETHFGFWSEINRKDTENQGLPDALTIGHPVIDFDHHYLIGLIQDIQKRLDSGHHEACSDLFDDFIGFLKDHLIREEEIFRQAGFKNLDEIAASHTHFLEKTTRLGKKCCSPSEKAGDGDRILEEIKSLLYDELLRVDLKFKDYLNH